MFGVLLESRATRQRRGGGMALSAAMHLAIIGAVTAATAHGASRDTAPLKPVFVHVDPPRPPAPEKPSVTQVRHVVQIADGPSLPTIQVPTVVPKGIPTIDVTQAVRGDNVILTLTGGNSPGRPGGTLDVSHDDTPSVLSGETLLMRVVRPCPPAYPEVLRRAGIDGRVVVRFTVDTTGRVEPASIEVVQSTHDTLTRAVRDALVRCEFRPTLVDGHRVPSLAEMPFEFKLR